MMTQNQICPFDMNKEKEPKTEEVAASDTKRIVIQLEHGKKYQNRKGGKVNVYRDDMLDDYPFRDDLGARYSSKGKVWSGMESDFDLVKAV